VLPIKHRWGEPWLATGGQQCSIAKRLSAAGCGQFQLADDSLHTLRAVAASLGAVPDCVHENAAAAGWGICPVAHTNMPLAWQADLTGHVERHDAALHSAGHSHCDVVSASMRTMGRLPCVVNLTRFLPQT
jgi:hypothetical protein